MVALGAAEAQRYTAKLSMEFVNHHYSIWIEAEEWAHGEWNPADDNSDVIVTFPPGERWVATFFSYQNIRSLIEKNLASGDCLGGKYLAATQMILVDEAVGNASKRLLPIL